MECYASSYYFFDLIPLFSVKSIAIMTFKVQLGNELLTTRIGHLVMNVWNWSNFISAREGGVVPVTSILVCIVQASIPQFLREGALIPNVNLISYTAAVVRPRAFAESRYAPVRTDILCARLPGACQRSGATAVVGCTIFVWGSMPDLHL